MTTMTDKLERQFHERLLDIYKLLAGQYGYHATRFIQMLNQQGAVETVTALIHSTEPSEGYTKLWELRRLDLSVEALSLRAEWQELFTDEDREAATARLNSYEFNFSQLTDPERG